MGKPENAGYHRDNPKNRERVKAWQKAHPGYWKRRKEKRSGVLQDLSRVQVPLLMGLIAHLGGLSYAEDIAAMTNRLVARGQALMGESL